MYIDLLLVSTNYEAIFREVKYKCKIHKKVWNEIIKYQNQSIDVK